MLRSVTLAFIGLISGLPVLAQPPATTPPPAAPGRGARTRRRRAIRILPVM